MATPLAITSVEAACDDKRARKSNGSTFWHGDDSMIRSCKQRVASETMLDSSRKTNAVKRHEKWRLRTKETTKMETTLLPPQALKNANVYEDIFNRQKAYFATNITRSYEWRVDQLDRLARLLSEHTNEFYDALSRDFKTALSEKVFEVAATLATIEVTKSF